MTDTRQERENLDALLQEWNAQLNESRAQIALFRKAAGNAKADSNSEYGRPASSRRVAMSRRRTEDFPQLIAKSLDLCRGMGRLTSSPRL